SLTALAPAFELFGAQEFQLWFQVYLVPVMPSLRPAYLRVIPKDISCASYMAIIVWLRSLVQQTLAADNSSAAFSCTTAMLKEHPACSTGLETDVEWIETNLGPFSQYTTYSDLKAFNLSDVIILDSFSPTQLATFLLEPNILSNENVVIMIFRRLVFSASMANIESFFDTFVHGPAEQNQTTLSPRIRDTILNLTLTVLGPKLSMLNEEELKLWFQVYLPLFLPSVDSRSFEIIPRNITCSSYQEILKGFNNIFSQLSEGQVQLVFMFALDYLRGQFHRGIACVTSDNRRWLEDNFGYFRFQASFMDFLSLKNDFRGQLVINILLTN
uniref:Uncharacterized protein n=1 Tax=Poecilia formosa TaxID=48698 RepID=A0A096LZA9_POEFO